MEYVLFRGRLWSQRRKRPWSVEGGGIPLSTGFRAWLFCEWRWRRVGWESFHDVPLLSPPQPILPRMHRLSSTPPYQRRLLQKSRSYIRLLCACFSGFSCVLLLCLSPLHWVRFTVLKDRQRLLAGLWTVCHHDLCWNHTPKAPCECFPDPSPLLWWTHSDPPQLRALLSPSHNPAPSFPHWFTSV